MQFVASGIKSPGQAGLTCMEGTMNQSSVTLTVTERTVQQRRAVYLHSSHNKRQCSLVHVL